jgi:DNA-binding response OmpR family regulator
MKKQKIILVIEDEQALLNAVQLKLEKNDFKILAVRSVERAFSTELEQSKNGELSMSSVERALNYLKDLESVDAIWLDHNLLGDENGLDFIRKFKNNAGRLSSVPIFVVSNTADPELVKSYMKLGATKYFVKAEHKLENIMQEIKDFLL